MYDLVCGQIAKYGEATSARCDDICAGRLYRELLSSQLMGTTQHYVSVIFNTDGIPVFKSSNYEFWPLFLLINELPYKHR